MLDSIPLWLAAGVFVLLLIGIGLTFLEYKHQHKDDDKKSN